MKVAIERVIIDAQDVFAPRTLTLSSLFGSYDFFYSWDILYFLDKVLSAGHKKYPMTFLPKISMIIDKIRKPKNTALVISKIGTTFLMMVIIY